MLSKKLTYLNIFGDDPEEIWVDGLWGALCDVDKMCEAVEDL